jgi:hypothetical protein
VPLPEFLWVSPWIRVNGMSLQLLCDASMVSHSFRLISDSEKLRIYVRIVRLLLEDEDSVQAETYYNRSALLVHSASDRETILQFKLCQARISDYSRKFLEAASRYHELSYVGEIDEEERRQMLYYTRNVPDSRRSN